MLSKPRSLKLTKSKKELNREVLKLRRRKYIKLSLAAEVLQQIICTIKIRCALTRHDNIDFGPLIIKTSEI